MIDRDHNDSEQFPVRIGIGWDLHRLIPPTKLTQNPVEGHGSPPARPLVIAGVTIEGAPGPISHSDGDVVYHAVTDAILGAMGEPDIGELFPNNDPRFESADSAVFVRAAIDRAAALGFAISNLDTVVILEQPKLAPYKAQMKQNLADLISAGPRLYPGPPLVNLKAKSHERVDAVGEGRAVEAHAVVLMRALPAALSG